MRRLLAVERQPRWRGRGGHRRTAVQGLPWLSAMVTGEERMEEGDDMWGRMSVSGASGRSRGILVHREIRTSACGPKAVKDVENACFRF